MVFDPFRDLERIKKDFERMLDRAPLMSGFREPLVDIKVEDKKVKVYVELPGVDKKDVGINVTKNELEVKSKARKEEKDEGEDYYRWERRYAGFYRLVPLPVEVIPDKTEAEFDDGVLEVTLKRAKPASKKKKYKVKIE